MYVKSALPIKIASAAAPLWALGIGATGPSRRLECEAKALTGLYMDLLYERCPGVLTRLKSPGLSSANHTWIVLPEKSDCRDLVDSWQIASLVKQLAAEYEDEFLAWAQRTCGAERNHHALWEQNPQFAIRRMPALTKLNWFSRDVQ